MNIEIMIGAIMGSVVGCCVTRMLYAKEIYFGRKSLKEFDKEVAR